MIEDVETRDGAWANRRPANWLDGVTPVPVPLADDGDGDENGMDDDWEKSHGLDPTNGNDHSTVMPSGCTAIEEYINGRADGLLAGIFSDGFESGDSQCGRAVARSGQRRLSTLGMIKTHL